MEGASLADGSGSVFPTEGMLATCVGQKVWYDRRLNYVRCSTIVLSGGTPA